MNRNLSLHFLTYYLTLVLAGDLFCLTETAFATSDPLKDLATGRALYWLILGSIAFVQGSLNGLIALLLKTQVFDNAGYRWAQAFWSGFPVSLLATILIDDLLGLSNSDSILESPSGFGLSLYLASYLLFNGSLMYIICRWAARE